MIKEIEYEILEDYSRGSDDKTFLCSDYEGLFFRKVAIGRKNIDKLRNQVDWINEHFDKIPLPYIDNVYVSKKGMYYDMRYYNGKTFSEYICENNNVEQNISILKSILNDLEENIYIDYSRQEYRDEPIQTYIQEKIIDNYNSMISNKAFDEILKYDYVTINGTFYPNIHMYNKFFDKSYLMDVFINDKRGDIHGDLTLENIIVSPENGEQYYLIDPNTNNTFDSIYLDYSKILQSLHGEYELIRKKNSRVVVDKNNIVISYERNANYEKLYSQYVKFLNSKFDYSQRKSIYFHEIVHWLRLYKYRNKHEPEKIFLYYAVFIKVLKDVYEMFGEGL